MTNVEQEYAPALQKALSAAISHLVELDSTPVAATADLHSLRTQLNRQFTDEGFPAERVIQELIEDVKGGIHGSAGGRFFGWVIGGALPAALAADWLTAAWDQNAALYACGPAAAVAEEVVGLWLKEILGLPETASFALVTGCQMAHCTCLAAARHAVLEQRGFDVESEGLWNAPQICIVANQQRHGSVDRALRLLGFGCRSTIDLATNANGQVLLVDLEDRLREVRGAPTIVILQAGDINTGACDPFHELIPIAKKYGAWVHVDGAFGLWATASARFKHLAQGIHTADSWATDGHKWLNVPFDCGYAFVAQANSHQAAMSHRAAYVTFDGQARDQMDWNPEWSRRARGFPTYAALRQLGRFGVARLVERCCDHAASLVNRIAQLPGVQKIYEPTLNQGLLRFSDPRPGLDESHHDQWTDEVIGEIQATGEAFFTGSAWHGRRVMRVSVCNWRTTEEDVLRAVRGVEQILSRKLNARSLV